MSYFDRGEERAVEVCRDERCVLEGLHASHTVKDSKRTKQRRQKQLGWRDDPFEKTTEIYERRCAEALDEAIIRAISCSPVRNFASLYHDIIHDYGSCGTRRLYRRLVALTRAKRIVRVDLGGCLCGYMRPGSRFLRDPEIIREQLEELIYTRRDRVTTKEFMALAEVLPA